MNIIIAVVLGITSIALGRWLWSISEEVVKEEHGGETMRWSIDAAGHAFFWGGVFAFGAALVKSVVNLLG